MPKKIILFSQPDPAVMAQITSEIFPDFTENKIFAYMPSDGGDIVANAQYTPFWQDLTAKNNAHFVFIDNSKTGEESKLLTANILMITGGNTFKLLKNLRDSGLDQAILQFWQKDGVVMSGFSAGAIILTPNIAVAGLGVVPDPNDVGLADLTALGILDFEIWPHYNETLEKQDADDHEAKSRVKLHRLKNDEILIINK
jgi:peptidase E